MFLIVGRAGFISSTVDYCLGFRVEGLEIRVSGLL